MKLTKEDIKSYLLSLPQYEREVLIEELKDVSKTTSSAKCQLSRCERLNNKQGACPHCVHAKYVNLGFEINKITDFIAILN